MNIANKYILRNKGCKSFFCNNAIDTFAFQLIVNKINFFSFV